MSRVFETIDEAKNFCLSHMKRDKIFTSYPPQHQFDDSVTVENVVQKIDNIKQALSYLKDGSVESEAAQRLRD